MLTSQLERKPIRFDKFDINNKDLKLLNTFKIERENLLVEISRLKEQELEETMRQLQMKENELKNKEVALNQNADLQRMNQKLLLNRRDMNDKFMSDNKKANSVLDFIAKDKEDQEVYMNQSMANFGWEDQTSYMVMNEKFKGLVELLKNKLDNLQRENERLDKKNQKYKNNNKELKEVNENLKGEMQVMETTNNLKEERINKLKGEVKELKTTNKEMAMEIEDSISKRPISARGRNLLDVRGSPLLQGSDLGNANTRNNFNIKGEDERNYLNKISELEREIETLRNILEERDNEIENLKELIKQNKMFYTKSLDQFKKEIHQKDLEYEELLERHTEIHNTSKKVHIMMQNNSKENMILKKN